MTQRSKQKNAVYWDGEVRNLENAIKRFAKLAAAEKDDAELRVQGLRTVLDRRLDLVRAQYSAGVAMSKIKKSVAELADAAAAYRADPEHAPLEVATRIAMTSVGLLLRAPAAQLDALAGAAGDDALLDRLVGRPAAGAAHAGAFAALELAMTDDDRAAGAARVAAYLTAYPGDWAFEAAAVVVVRGLDDAAFRGDPHYPAELADHARAG